MIHDEEFYGLAAREIAERQHNQSLMAKAYAFALGDPAKTEALYIGMRADQLKQEAVTLARESQERARLQKAAEQGAREGAERQRVAAERARKNEEEAERRRQQEIEAQRAGDAWQRNEAGHDRWANLGTDGSANKGSADSPPPKQSQPSPPMSPEELDRTIESLKKAQNRKSSFF